MVEVPVEVGILPLPSREVEPCPCFYLLWFFDVFCPVGGIHLYCLELFFIVCCSLMIQDHIRIDLHAMFMNGIDQLMKFLFGAILGPD